MKNFIIALAVVATSVAANAVQLKTYDCRGSRAGGSITADLLTVQANRDSLVMSFPGISASEVAQPSFERARGLGNERGGLYFVNKNPGSMFREGKRIDHTVMRAFVTHGMIRQDNRASLVITYKKTERRFKRTNESQWERAYRCVAR